LQQQVLPNNILFVENLTPTVTADMLETVFAQYPGYREVRMIPTKRVAFVEYEDDFKAGLAMSSLNGNKLGDYQLQISYAKRS